MARPLKLRTSHWTGKLRCKHDKFANIDQRLGKLEDSADLLGQISTFIRANGLTGSNGRPFVYLSKGARAEQARIQRSLEPGLTG